jgi:LacI family transcriptional regulator
MRPVKSQSGRAKRPTLRDVAFRAGVSHQTVSRVINSHGYVHKETRERVLNAIKDLDFVPNGVARSLTANRTQTIGVVTTDISEHFFGEFVAGAEAEARRNGFYLIIGSVEEDAPADEHAYLQLMLERRVEGLIIARPMLRRDSQQIVAALARRVPIVLVSSELNSPALDSVDVDNEGGGHDATKYLLERGHQSIATIVGPSGWPSAQARLKGYRHALRAHRIPFTKSLVRHANGWGLENGEAAMENLLAEGVRFTALFAQSDYLALGAVTAMRRRGLRVPADVSVVGYDDIPVAQHLDPPLTTMRQPMREVGAAALQLVLQKIHADERPSGPPSRHLLAAGLIVRDSVAGPARDV